jgi:hypothetical protein
MLQLVYSDQIAQEQYHERLDAAAAARRLATAYHSPRTIVRRTALFLGRALLQLGVGLLRYGRAETPATMRVYRPSRTSIRLN